MYCARWRETLARAAPKACIIASVGCKARLVGRKAIALMWVDIIIIAFSIAVLFVCGFMESIGTRTPLLMLNRVPLRRSVYHWAVFAGVHVLGQLLWAASVWGLVQLIYGHRADFSDVVLIVAISYLPTSSASCSCYPIWAPC